jgi:hypothetical protein
LTGIDIIPCKLFIGAFSLFLSFFRYGNHRTLEAKKKIEPIALKEQAETNAASGSTEA